VIVRHSIELLALSLMCTVMLRPVKIDKHGQGVGVGVVVVVVVGVGIVILGQAVTTTGVCSRGVALVVVMVVVGVDVVALVVNGGGGSVVAGGMGLVAGGGVGMVAGDLGMDVVGVVAGDVGLVVTGGDGSMVARGVGVGVAQPASCISVQSLQLLYISSIVTDGHLDVCSLDMKEDLEIIIKQEVGAGILLPSTDNCAENICPTSGSILLCTLFNVCR